MPDPLSAETIAELSEMVAENRRDGESYNGLTYDEVNALLDAASETASLRAERDQLLSDCSQLRDELSRRAKVLHSTIAAAAQVTDERDSLRSEVVSLRAEVERLRATMADIFNSVMYGADADTTKGMMEARLGDIASIADRAIGPLANPFRSAGQGGREREADEWPEQWVEEADR